MQDHSPTQTLVVEIDALPRSIDPGTIFDFAGELIGSALSDRLFVEKGEAGEVTEGLIHRLTPARDLKQFRLEFRTDCGWSDGSPIFADDIKRAVEFLGSAESQAPLAWIVDAIAGGRDRRRGLAGSIKGCRVVSPHVLELNLDRPLAYLPQLLASSCFSPRPRSYELCSGPYTLIGTFPNDRGLILQANPRARIWKDSSPHRLVFLRTNDADQGIRMYDEGKIHITCNTTFPHSLIGEYAGRKCFMAADMSMAAYLQPNPISAPCLSSMQLRKALSLAIDRYAIAESLHGAVSPMWRFTELWSPDNDTVPRQSPDLSRAMLRQVRDLPCRLGLSFADFPPNGEAAAMIAEQVEDVLGLTLDLLPLSYESYISCVFRGGFDLLYTLSPSSYPDASCFLVPFTRGGALALRTKFADPHFESLLAHAEGLSERRVRQTGYERANDRLLETLPVIPLFRVSSGFLRKPWLDNVILSRNGLIHFAEIRFNPVDERANVLEETLS